AVEHRVERAVEQHLHETVGGVVAAARLAGVALCLAALSESEAAPVVSEARGELQEALVDRAQLLGFHVAPVHGHEARILLQPGQAVERLHKAAVGKLGSLQIRYRSMHAEPVEGRQAEPWLAAGKAAEGNDQSF